MTDGNNNESCSACALSPNKVSHESRESHVSRTSCSLFVALLRPDSELAPVSVRVSLGLLERPACLLGDVGLEFRLETGVDIELDIGLARKSQGDGACGADDGNCAHVLGQTSGWRAQFAALADSNMSCWQLEQLE